MNENIKSKTKTKNIYSTYKQYILKVRFESDVVFLKTFITELNDLISSTKTLYYHKIMKTLGKN